MKTTKKIALILTLSFFCLALIGPVRAAAPATLALSNTSGDAVQVSITGEPNTNIQLSFLPQGASSITSIAFGTTNAGGSFTTTISSGGYGIPAGSPVYVTIGGMQSQTILWPTYTSSITFSQNSVTVAVGQYVNVTSSNSLFLAANSLSTSIGTSISGGQITITGLANGTGSVTLCGANVGCGKITVDVGGQGQTQITFSQNNVVLNSGQSKNIDIFGGSNNGYFISSNSNPVSVNASISGKVGVISLFGNNTGGTATIVVCSADNHSNCANLNLTVLNTSSSVLTFSQNNLTLIPGLAQSVTVSGGPDNNYYIASNSNPGVANVTVSGNIVNVVGGSTYSTTAISVCSATVNATCATLNVTTNSTSATPSATTIAFSQNVVSVAAGDNTLVTISGGTGTGYTISSNSSSTVATASINGSSNVMNIYGVSKGSTIISVCSASVGTTCASLYVNVGDALTPITFNKNNVVLKGGESTNVIVSGGTGTGKTLTTNTNPAAIIATLNNDGTILTLTGGTAPGSTAITICSTNYTSNCASITALLTGSSNSNTTPSTPADNSNSTTPATPAQTQLQKIMADASNVYQRTGFARNTALEAKVSTAYANILSSGSSLDSAAQERIINFIAYGSPTTLSLGEGERAGVLGSYQKAFNKLPATENEWADAIKIANGRWPSESSAAALASAQTEFKRVYKRVANMANANDSAAITIIAYGLRNTARNTSSEKAAIISFKKIYGHAPTSSLAWDIVRAIAYSGAKR